MRGPTGPCRGGRAVARAAGSVGQQGRRCSGLTLAEMWICWKVATRATGITQGWSGWGPPPEAPARVDAPSQAGATRPQQSDPAPDGQRRPRVRAARPGMKGERQQEQRAAAVVWSTSRPWRRGWRRWPGRRRRGWSCRRTPRTGCHGSRRAPRRSTGAPAAGWSRSTGWRQGSSASPPEASSRSATGAPRTSPSPSATAWVRSGTRSPLIEAAPAMDGTSSAVALLGMADRRAGPRHRRDLRGGPPTPSWALGGWPTT